MTLIDANVLARAIAAAAQEGNYGAKHDAPGVTPTSGYAHGPGGLLTYPGVNPDVFSTIMGTVGMIDQLPSSPSVYTNPTYEVITGIQADPSTTETGDACDNALTGGLMKAGIVTFPFGRLERATRELEINRMGQRNDRGDPLDLRLMNRPTGTGPFSSMGVGGNPLTNELDKALWERAVSFHRKLSRMVWTGNPANTPGQNQMYREFAGFDVLINTGYRDAINNAALTAVDSYVRNFNNARIDLGTNGNLIVNEITNMIRQVRFKADHMNVSPVRWVLAMREGLFYELTKIWPCAYMTGGCTVLDANSQTVFINASDTIEMRDKMRQGRFLIADGQMIDVVIDDGIDEDDGNESGGSYPRGCFRSDIYLIPLSVLGGQAVTFLEYFDYSNPSIQSAQATGLLMVRPVANGAFLETSRQTNWCFVLQAKVEPRIVMRTPWLAARLQNIVYCPIEHTAESFPDSAYWKDGGSTSRPGPSLFAHWQS